MGGDGTSTLSEIHSPPSIYSAYEWRLGLDRLRGESSRNKNRSPRRPFQILRWPYQPHIPNLRQKGRRCRRSCHPEPAQLFPMEETNRPLNYKPANWDDIYPNSSTKTARTADTTSVCLPSIFLPSTSSLRTISHIRTNRIQPSRISDFQLNNIILHRLPQRAMVEQNRPPLPKRRRRPIPLHTHHPKIRLSFWVR